MARKHKDCSGCYDKFSKRNPSYVTCTRCSREYCKSCGKDQMESYYVDDGALGECEKCEGKPDDKLGSESEQEAEQEQYSEEEAERDPVEEIGCAICSKSHDEEKMLLCDGCDGGFHLYCLNPPLEEVPEGEWFCPECTSKRQSGENGGKAQDTTDAEDAEKTQNTEKRKREEAEEEEENNSKKRKEE